jgi:cystathionine beta-lyase
MTTHSKETLAVHSGHIDSSDKGTNNPVYTSTSYKYLEMGDIAYTRYSNTPNQKAVVEKVASLENAETGIVFSSGLSAVSSTLFTFLRKGDHIIFQQGLYGGTTNFILNELEKFGIEYTLLENNSLSSFQSAVKKNTKLIYLETPSNPLLSIINLKEMADFAKEHSLISIVDNTFASPVNQTPKDFGIDLVLHSATKYLGGHSDICAGFVLGNNDKINKIQHTALNYGGSLNPLMCHLLERSLKTLYVRVTNQNKNALQIAHYLEAHEKIEKVNYPGLSNHPEHETAKKQMHGFGGMLSFELKDQDIVDFQKRLKLIIPAISLGGIETIISAPVLTSHKKLSEEQRQKEGITNKLLRLSVGIEHVDDLIADLEQALKTESNY